MLVDLGTEPCLAFARGINRRSLHVILAKWVKYGTSLAVVKSAVPAMRPPDS